MIVKCKVTKSFKFLKNKIKKSNSKSKKKKKKKKKNSLKLWGGSSCGIVIYMLACNANKFELQLHYYTYFQTNIIWKGMNLLIHPQLRVK